MSQIFRRVYKLTIGNGNEAIVIDGFQQNPLQVKFFVDQTPNGRVSYADIKIYGLSRETIKRVREQYTDVHLVAGYADHFGTVFLGHLIRSTNLREGPNQYLQLFCRSGGKPVYVNQSWGKGTPQKQIIEDVAKTFGYPVEFHGDFSSLPRAPAGNVLSMGSKMAMDKLAASWGFRWMVRNQVVLIVADNAVIEGEEYIYSGLTGMIGLPRITEKGVDVTVKMNPSLRPGATYRIQSEGGRFVSNEVYYDAFHPPLVTGRFKIISMRINGDFYGDPWDMELEGIRV